MKKVIGIPGYLVAGKVDHFGAGVNHLEFISNFGNARIIMPWEEYVEGLDMLYLPGGLDTSPANYGAAPRYKTSHQDVHKEFFFTKRLAAYVEAGVPIFGVCLGAQMLAAFFGGKLTQHLMFHEQSTDRWKTAHKIKAADGSRGTFEYNGWRYQMAKYEVNSHHHQALTIKGLADTIQPLMLAENNDTSITKEEEIVEAFKIVDRPIYGVQWHPEELYDPFACNLVKELLNINE